MTLPKPGYPSGSQIWNEGYMVSYLGGWCLSPYTSDLDSDRLWRDGYKQAGEYKCQAAYQTALKRADSLLAGQGDEFDWDATFSAELESLRIALEGTVK